MTDLFAAFAGLHCPGDPLILFNAWDAGSAQAVARAGAQAIATGSWSVAAAHGAPDGEGLPLGLALANARRMVTAVDLPVTIDFEGGYAVDPGLLADHFAALAETGAVGANFEDGMIDGAGLHPLDQSARRVATARGAVPAGFFLNARTDLFLQAAAPSHDRHLADAAIERGLAYADAGASGLFVPGLIDLKLVERIARAVPLPLNVMAFPGAPSARAFGEAGVARISHGPNPWRLAMKELEDAARAALKK
ncbi:isocitrate lyase/PEP mutase family protein [Sphingomonas sp.]|uniref:isocitrate lyase/PEP mutase family protein n=1 Tax=Sphingomonas sp. TaxID=28214 RepID=UPI002DD63269|nr:isocitrate lyase/phosphoenolpyruvate mutase family protein [Sphingomonas sp.]